MNEGHSRITARDPYLHCQRATLTLHYLRMLLSPCPSGEGHEKTQWIRVLSPKVQGEGASLRTASPPKRALNFLPYNSPPSSVVSKSTSRLKDRKRSHLQPCTRSVPPPLKSALPSSSHSVASDFPSKQKARGPGVGSPASRFVSTLLFESMYTPLIALRQDFLSERSAREARIRLAMRVETLRATQKERLKYWPLSSLFLRAKKQRVLPSQH